MGKWRKLPVEVEAVQFLGDNWAEIARFVGNDEDRVEMVEDDGPGVNYLLIETIEGKMRADPYTWLIRGVDGELYPCANHIFLATYERVD